MHFYIYSGTFAIVSLMVGEVVQKGVSAQLGVMPTNVTLIPFYEAEEAEIRVKIAVVSSFTVGIIQVAIVSIYLRILHNTVLFIMAKKVEENG